MSSGELKSSAQKVQDFLAQHGQAFQVKQLTSSTRTAAEAAESIGCSIGQIAKSLIFKNKKSEEPVLIVASGSNMVDVRKVEKALGVKLSKPDADYVREHVGYAIGGVPPVAHKTKLFTVLDPDLKAHDEIWAAAGTPNSMFALKPSDLDALTEGQWVELAKG
ncbi:YbaK/EbsC family protein [Vibrio sp.]|uniref:YbaK/EbsC family protein n=1 Tax=Vibrio viridaestus TaxID=2487322 RepID=A0A3N9THE1_9VIBR|nr:YbaK/EbsC family protein [Vibrio viridaestus]MDC0610724.1 YbaK/EbsC family protein [Vibrio sp.]RQW63647.1 YbaK/EbsC family protein [Vibrio viridaestus]